LARTQCAGAAENRRESLVVIVQAGHQNIATNCSPDMRSGTGAPGERDWTPAVAVEIVRVLVGQGVQARAVDANFNCDAAAVGQDYEAVVSVHYQANLPTASGFYVGAGDPVEDGARARSGALAQAMFAQYQQATGLPWRPSWNNVNITHYYLFEALSKATPFVLIECGVGAPGAPDHDFLHSADGQAKVVRGIANGVLVYLGKPVVAPSPVPGPPPSPAPASIDPAEYDRAVWLANHRWATIQQIKALVDAEPVDRPK
jgi:N-acetylmuramoyl-L-alanine amidase